MITNWQPKRTKFKRLHKGVVLSCQHKLPEDSIMQGVMGLRILKRGRLTVKQLEQMRRRIVTVRKKKEKQKIWFRCIPDIPVTAKPLGIRMGKGKGGIKSWITRVPAGKVIMQINYMTKKRVQKALYLAKKMLPVPSKIVKSAVLNQPLNKRLRYVF